MHSAIQEAHLHKHGLGLSTRPNTRNVRESYVRLQRQSRIEHIVVGDVAAFTRALAHLSIRVMLALEAVAPNRVYLVAETDHGTWPSAYFDEEANAEVEVDLLTLIATHLAAGEVAVLKEAGAEKASYVGGVALAVNANGQTAKVDLDEIYRRAEELGPHVSPDV